LIKQDGFEGFHTVNDRGGLDVAEAQTGRELTEFEKNALEEMKQNDEEIDELIDQAIGKLDKIKMHAQDINAETKL